MDVDVWHEFVKWEDVPFLSVCFPSWTLRAGKDFWCPVVWNCLSCSCCTAELKLGIISSSSPPHSSSQPQIQTGSGVSCVRPAGCSSDWCISAQQPETAGSSLENWVSMATRTREKQGLLIRRACFCLVQSRLCSGMLKYDTMPVCLQ